MDYISTHFGVDSASHFPFRVSTDTTDHSTHDSVTADVKEAYSSLCYKHRTATTGTCIFSILPAVNFHIRNMMVATHQ